MLQNYFHTKDIIVEVVGSIPHDEDWIARWFCCKFFILCLNKYWTVSYSQTELFNSNKRFWRSFSFTGLKVWKWLQQYWFSLCRYRTNGFKITLFPFRSYIFFFLTSLLQLAVKLQKLDGRITNFFLKGICSMFAQDYVQFFRGNDRLYSTARYSFYYIKMKISFLTIRVKKLAISVSENHPEILLFN